jgi:hypothetical protein
MEKDVKVVLGINTRGRVVSDGKGFEHGKSFLQFDLNKSCSFQNLSIFARIKIFITGTVKVKSVDILKVDNNNNVKTESTNTIEL